MERGMVFTIEPMFCQGTALGMQWPDKWTVATADGGRSAQFEHTVSCSAIEHSGGDGVGLRTDVVYSCCTLDPDHGGRSRKADGVRVNIL